MEGTWAIAIRRMLVYLAFNDDDFYKELKLSSEQQQKLSEIGTNAGAEQEKLVQALPQLSPPERLAREKRAYAKYYESESAIRGLLTAEQLTILKSIVFQDSAGTLLGQNRFAAMHEKLGLSAVQTKELVRLREEMTSPRRQALEEIIDQRWRFSA